MIWEAIRIILMCEWGIFITTNKIKWAFRMPGIQAKNSDCPRLSCNEYFHFNN